MLKNMKTTAEPYCAQKGKTKCIVAFCCLFTDPKQSIASSTHLWPHRFTPPGGNRQIMKMVVSGRPERKKEQVLERENERVCSKYLLNTNMHTRAKQSEMHTLPLLQGKSDGLHATKSLKH